jgi:hypothetical protein
MYLAQGKGDTPRPSTVSRQEQSDNFSRIFLEKCSCNNRQETKGGYCDSCGKSTRG